MEIDFAIRHLQSLKTEVWRHLQSLKTMQCKWTKTEDIFSPWRRCNASGRRLTTSSVPEDDAMQMDEDWRHLQWLQSSEDWRHLQTKTEDIFSPWRRCNANGRSQNALSFLHYKENAPCYGNNPKKRFVGSNSQVY